MGFFLQKYQNYSILIETINKWQFKMRIDEIKARIYPTLIKFGVKKASLFGSTVRGNVTKKSDVDILVSLPKNASLLDLVGLKMNLEEVLGKKVDVLTYDSLHPLLRDRILDEQVPIL